MRQFLLIILVLTVLSACNSGTIKDTELHNLVSLLTGEFSNKEQIEKDATFSYLNLNSTRIWKDKPGYWVYTEVSEADGNKYIYSKRILKYERIDSSNFKSTSYEILNANDYEFSSKNTAIFDTLTMGNLEIKEGCEVHFTKKTSTIYAGKTNEECCKSTMKSVDYITSTFVVSKDKVSVWTRGYNTEGKHVFGKINGPYKYKKTNKK